MAPLQTEIAEENKPTDTDTSSPAPPRKIVWLNVFYMSLLHVFAAYGLYLLIFHALYATLAWSVLLYLAGGLGVTAGAHRLWSHRSYKATWPLRVFLMLMNCISGENSLYEWARDHRVHHKYSETDADPHNATRGWFFAHVGWLLVRKHPDVITKGKKIDLSDLATDKVIMFQKRYYKYLMLVCNIIIPSVVPVLWGESIWNAYFISFALRYTLILHGTWCVNSAAHMWGNHPYDKNIHPAENMFVSLVAVGEGFHNYHHTFPHDYSTSEFGIKLNITTVFIDLCAWFGLAYDRRTISKEVILNRRRRTGDLQGMKEE